MVWAASQGLASSYPKRNIFCSTLAPVISLARLNAVCADWLLGRNHPLCTRTQVQSSATYGGRPVYTRVLHLTARKDTRLSAKHPPVNVGADTAQIPPFGALVCVSRTTDIALAFHGLGHSFSSCLRHSRSARSSTKSFTIYLSIHTRPSRSFALYLAIHPRPVKPLEAAASPCSLP